MGDIDMKELPRSTVLCVESNADSRECLRHALQSFDCAFACSAYEAIGDLHARPFDAYVLDYWMPDWSGPLLCREIRKHDPHSPVIVCIEKSMEAHRRTAVRARANVFIEKPIDQKTLCLKLDMLLMFANREAVRAKYEAVSVLEDELRRRGAVRLGNNGLRRANAGLNNTVRSVERTARARAYRTFINSGGTRAGFQRWWPDVFAPTFARYEFA